MVVVICLAELYFILLTVDNICTEHGAGDAGQILVIHLLFLYLLKERLVRFIEANTGWLTFGEVMSGVCGWCVVMIWGRALVWPWLLSVLTNQSH